MKEHTLGHKLSTLRRQKGLTQEELAIATGITSRTIQRIENNQVKPQPHTLRLIAEKLESDPGVFFEENENIAPVTTNSLAPAFSNSKLILLHLLPAIVLMLPFANVLAPLFYWLFIKDQHPLYDRDGRQLVNFQATLSLIGVCAIILLVLFFPVGAVLLIFTYALGIIYMVINIRKILNGQSTRYPASLRILPLKQKEQQTRNMI